ncbi:MAG: sulfite exporter TauE/SafE family protein [Sphingomicrobium sp.]
MIALALAFFVTAVLYAIAGFGGGSTYTALLVLAGTDYRAVPILSLACNILVVSVGTWRFANAGHFDWRRAWPLFVTSVPAAWIGGRLHIEKELFVALLAVSLLVAGLAMLWQPKWKREITTEGGPRWIEPVAGGTLGLLAGIVGIGGGIFLAPLLYLLRWDAPRRIAATCAAFILVNSIAGLAGQASKGLATATAVFSEHVLLFPAVIVGGLIGAGLGSKKLAPDWVRVVTALLILYVAVRLGLEAIR